MSERKTSFVPINELTSPRMRIVLPLPTFIDQSQILVNQRAMDRLCGIAGIRHLRVVASEDGETSNFVPTIVGFDANGGAYAGKIGLKTKVPEYSAESARDGNQLWFTRQVSGTIKVNIEEMSKSIAEEKRWRNGVYSPQPWALHLDRILRMGLLKIGGRHLVCDFTKKDLFLIGYVQTLLPIFFPFDPVVDIVVANLWMNVAYFSLGKIRDQYVRPSLIFGPQLDRALIFSVYLARQTLVKASQPQHLA